MQIFNKLKYCFIKALLTCFILLTYFINIFLLKLRLKLDNFLIIKNYNDDKTREYVI